MFNLFALFIPSRKKSFCPALFALFAAIAPLLLKAQGPCDCTNCPQTMPDGFTGQFYIQIQNATNPTLGQNGQGVCGVRLNFDHEYIGDLQITLTSPAGQSVTLIGPIGLFGETDGTSWNILFLPCGDPVNPDPGFSNQWNNNQPWGLFGNYTGSYYPNAGCLQNFNSGSVNGQWTLTVIDGQALDMGNFYDYEIIFCDPSGIECYSCEANAGNLLQPNVAACEGASTLNLNLPPTYTPPNVAPPASDYSYTYIVGGAGGVIEAYEPGPDLTSYPPGNYTVCGLSYLSNQEGDLPPPDGSLTIAQLSTQLNSSTPPFCGDITSNCVNVTINAAPEDIEEFQEICAPQCYVFFNQNYCQSGTYVRTLTQNGCTYTATLYLTVYQPSFTNIVETICPDGCSQTPGFESACAPGAYSETFINAAGCDSTVNLTLVEMSINASIAPPPTIDCGQASVQLQGTGSTTGPGTTYQWTPSNGGNIQGSSTGINVNITTPGDYQLKVCRSQGGAFCCDSTSVTVTGNQNPPPPPGTITGPNQLCDGDTETFSINAVTGATSYTWAVPTGVTINSGQGTTSISVTWNSTLGGNICVTANNACGSSTPPTCTSVTVSPAPSPSIPQGATTVCVGNTESYSIPAVNGATSYNWTVTAPAIVASGQGTTNITVNWGNMTSGDVCVNVESSCGTSQDECLSVQVNAAPAEPVVAGSTAVCAGSNQTYTVTPVAGETYNWQITGGTITSGNGTASVQVTWDAGAANGSICATAVNSCGSSAQNCLAVTLATPPAQPDISGDATLCSGADGAYSIAPIAGATGYEWTVPINSSIISGQNTTSIVANFADLPGGDVCVAAISGCGTGPADCFPVTVIETPIANAGADDSECGTTASLQAISSVQIFTGNWVLVSGPGTATFSNPNEVATTVTVNQTGTYVFQWTEINGICSDVDSVTIDFNEPPAAGQITTDCNSTNDSYTVSFPIVGSTAPPFTIPGGTVTNGVFTSDPIPSGQSYAFIIEDANGCLSQSITGTVNCLCASNAGQMSLQMLSACEGDTIFAQHLGGETLDPNDTFSFILHGNSGPSLGGILQQNATGVFAFQNGMIYGKVYYVSFTVGNNLNGFPDTLDPCLSVAQGQPVVFFQNPVSNAGLDTDTCGFTLQLNANDINGTGEWSVTSTPVGGTLNFSNIQDSASTVTANLPGGYVLTWTVDVDGCTDTDEVEVQFNESPTLADLVRTCDAANENFTVTLTISGGTAPYNVNGNAVTGNTFSSTPFANGESYSFTVTDANGCSMPTVNGAFSCNCTTDAGIMQADTISVCEDLSATVAPSLTPSVLDGNDVTAYVLHSGNGPVLGQIFAQNLTGIFELQPGMIPGQVYYISIVVGNNLNGTPDPADPCFSVAVGQPVIFVQNPKPNAGADEAVCGQTIDLQAVPNNFPNSWSQISGPGVAIFANNTDPESGVSVPDFGTYIFEWRETNGACTGADTVSITFNELPTVSALVETCNSANTQYNVSFTANGGTAPYTVSGLNGTFSGNNFTSSPVTNNSTYTFVVVDANGCESPAISGVENCNCLTDAGSMLTSPLAFCAGDAAVAVWNNDASLDTNDVVQFILHDQASATVGTVFATNAQPTFAFTGNLQTGVTYYISAVAGNNLAGGAVDLNDACLSVTPGTPVQWKPLPNVSLTGDATICAGGNATLTFSGNGVFPLEVVYQDDAGTQNTLTINNQQPTTVQVSPTATTVFTLVSVADGTAPTCSVQLSEIVTITVSQPLTAGFANEPVELCAGIDLPLQLINFLTGADPGGQWAETSVVPSLPGGFNAATGTFETASQPAGTYTFRYLLSPPAPCPADEETVTVKLLAQPIADAGEDQAINCDQTAVLLGGENTTVGSGIFHIWTLNGDTVGNTEQVFISTAGDYILIVSNSAGCSSSDATTVILDNDPPVAEIVLAQSVRCFGDKDGIIIIDSITSTNPPTLYSLNGGAFSPNPIFAGLAPGTYTVTLMDANGCESTTQPITVGEPPEIKIELGADVEAALGDSVYLSLTNLGPTTIFDTILWQPLLDTTAAGKDFQHFLPLKSLKVEVTVTDTNGCVARDEVLVNVDRTRHVYVPNIFNPQSSQEPVLQVYGGQDVERVDVFRVYDRWGELLFEARDFLPNNPAYGWTGRHGNGKEVMPGVYVYYAVVRFIDGKEEIFSGDVTVFR